MKNRKLEIALLDAGIKKYELVKLLGISYATFNRLTREELPEEKQDEMIRVINEEVKRREQEGV